MIEEEWKDIKEFPGYRVSNLGRIFSERTETMLRFSLNSTGTLKVNLMMHNQTLTRSVRVLVAEAFLSDDPWYDNVTPINLDGDHWNNRADNLLWRPRWFAWKYMRQFTEPVPPEYLVPVLDRTTGREFDSTVRAGITDGVLWEYIYQSILTDKPVFPTGGVFQLR